MFFFIVLAPGHCDVRFSIDIWWSSCYRVTRGIADHANDSTVMTYECGSFCVLVLLTVRSTYNASIVPTSYKRCHSLDDMFTSTFIRRAVTIVNCHEAVTILGVLANSSCCHLLPLKHVVTMLRDSIAVNVYPIELLHFFYKRAL